MIAQPFASVMFTVYVPATNPVTVAVVALTGDQLYVYGAVPPDVVIVAVPFVPPEQLTVVALVAAVNAVGCVIVAAAVPEQPRESVTVTVYVPACNPDAVGDDPPEGDQLYAYGPAPPITVVAMEPLFALKQFTLVAVAVTVTAVGCVIVKTELVWQFFASFTVTV